MLCACPWLTPLALVIVQTSLPWGSISPSSQGLPLLTAAHVSLVVIFTVPPTVPTLSSCPGNVYQDGEEKKVRGPSFEWTPDASFLAPGFAMSLRVI